MGFLTGFIGSGCTNVKIAVASAGIAYGGYYFVNTDEQPIYMKIAYAYRELGKGRFDMTGNYMGNYQIKRVIRTTKNKNLTGGQQTVEFFKSTDVTAI